MSHIDQLYVGSDPSSPVQVTDTSGNLFQTGTQITSTAAELNYLDIATLGTGVASKAVVPDANGDFTVAAGQWTATAATFNFNASTGLEIGGTAVSKTAAQINALVIGVAGGYKLARGSSAVTGSASINTGLTTVVDFCAVPYADSAAKANYAVTVSIADAVAAGYIKVYRWKHTSAGTTTLVAATTAGTINWIAVGT